MSQTIEAIPLLSLAIAFIPVVVSIYILFRWPFIIRYLL